MNSANLRCSLVTVVDLLPGHRKAQPIQQAEGVQVRGAERSVIHVEVFPVGSVRTPIIGRPRPLPSDRRAGPLYTLNCEEPHIEPSHRGGDHGQSMLGDGPLCRPAPFDRRPSRERPRLGQRQRLPQGSGPSPPFGVVEQNRRSVLGGFPR